METQLQEQQPNPADTTAKADPKPADLSREELVKEINHWVKETASFWEPMFERMRDKIDFAGGDQWDEGKTDSTCYQVNFVQRQLNQDVAAKYARNPQVTIERKKRLEHTKWDGTMEQLQQAKMALQQAAEMALQDSAATGTPQEGPPTEFAEIVMDYAQGLQRKKLFDRIAETLEMLITFEMEEQRPDFESEMKSLSLREGVTGAGFLFIKFQRETETVPTTTATTVGVLEKMQAIQARARELSQDPTYSEDSACAEELKLMVQSLTAQLEQQEVKLLREGVVFDFKPTTSILIDPACRSLHEFVGAGRIAELLYLTPRQVEAQWGKNVKCDGTARYADDGSELSFAADKKGQTRSDGGKSTEAWPDGAKVRVAIVYDKKAQLKYVVCDGYPDFLEEPDQPWPAVKGFWPCAALKYQRVEVEKNKPKEGITIFGQSKVDLMRPMQCELNRSQEGKREHRIGNRPGYLFAEGSIDATEAALIGGMAANSGLGLKNIPPGTDLRSVIIPKPTVPIDPALYERESVMNDVFLAVGSQSSNLGAQQGNEKATGQAIAEQSRVTGVSSEVDEQDKFLTEVMRIAGEMLLQGMQESTVKRKVGPGAVWPLSQRGMDGMQAQGVLTIEDCLDQLVIKIEAASSGRANQALDIANWKEMWPSLLAAAQALGLSLAPLLKEQAKILGFKFDLDEWLASAPPMMPMGLPGQPPAPGQPQTGAQRGAAPDPAGMRARIANAPAA
jgi:methylmalonyl-CoA mutase cobalamin-binding subunit